MGNIFGDAWNGVTEGASEAAGWVGEKASAAGGAVHDIYSSATGGQTNAQQAVQEKIQGAKKDAHQDLARLRKERSGLDVGESDPASIKQHDNWDNWNRDQLANKLKPSLKHGQITSAAEDWKNLGKEINEIFADLDKQTRQAAGDGMRGEAAEAGMNAAKPLQDWGTKFGEAVRGTGFKMEEAGIAAERTHSSIQEAPEPSNARAVIDGGMNVIAPGSGVVDGGNQMREREEGERQARQIVKNVYSPGYDKVDGSTPSLPKPVDPLNPSKSGDGNANGDGMPAGQTPGGGGSTTATPASMSASTAGDPGSSSVPGGTANPGTGSPASPGNNPSSPASNSSASAIPPGAGTPGGPGSGTPGMTSPGGPGGGGGAAFGAMPGGGAPGGAPGGGQPGGQGGARGGPGAGGRAGVGGSGGGQGGTAAAQGGGQNGGGRGGMGGGGQRGGGQQEDEEHERPSWLEENDDVWFNDMPKTAPPVLGG